MDKNFTARSLLGIFLAALIFPIAGSSQEIATSKTVTGYTTIFSMSNNIVTCKVVVDSLHLGSDTLAGNSAWLGKYGCEPVSIATDADYGLRFVWTDWQAPNTGGNAENPVTLGKNDFVFSAGEFHSLPDSSVELDLNFHSPDTPYNPILLRITYHLDPYAFYVKRKIAVSDTIFGHHFLDVIDARSGKITGISGNKGTTCNIIKEGGFGQPVAITFKNAGAFFGLEYPASVNSVSIEKTTDTRITCSQEFGLKPGKEVIESEWVVEALIPGTQVKNWFFRYLDRERISPVKPYALYNSWYDLRSPEYPKVEPDHIMNEKNVMNIISLFQKNMIEKHHIALDAFVLDDGWDVYESDWQLRKEMFPNGLKPVADELKKLGTGLGIWYGPTGGYSFRMRRVNWMGDHGYETVGVNRDNKMLCLAGKNYSELFRKRVTDMVSLDGVSYFKWDGIQFSCSEEDHGHPVGIYSRRAIMESVIDKCNAVRKLNPGVFLNITSGTWLSPWWMKYANIIWMQGEDYGYADIPSINRRDAAMTYKDLVLYEDLRKKDLWFPVSGLMTHGIIKGNLEKLGGEDDPLDKFTNDVVFYLARGVSMYELYISPDLLNDREWDAIGKAIAWAKDRFDILSSTYMVGGSVPDGETYGYVHFRGNRGIIAARNPVIGASTISITLSSDLGLDPGSSNLLLEKVYPYHYVYPEIYKSGNTLTLPLEGFETAVFELVPASDEKNASRKSGKSVAASPEAVKSKEIKISVLKNGKLIHQRLELDPTVKDTRFAVLLEPGAGSGGLKFPVLSAIVNGKTIINPSIEQEQGKWKWWSVITGSDVREIELSIAGTDSLSWTGTATLYLICNQQQEKQKVHVKDPARPMLPLPFGEGIVERTVELGKLDIEIK